MFINIYNISQFEIGVTKSFMTENLFHTFYHELKKFNTSSIISWEVLSVFLVYSY